MQSGEDAMPAYSGLNVLDAERAQHPRDKGSGSLLVVAQFWVLVQVMPNSDDFGQNRLERGGDSVSVVKRHFWALTSG
jgi:hypothetical protein